MVVHVPSTSKHLEKSLLDPNSQGPSSPMSTDLHYSDEELMRHENVRWGGSQGVLFLLPHAQRVPIRKPSHCVLFFGGKK